MKIFCAHTLYNAFATKDFNKIWQGPHDHVGYVIIAQKCSKTRIFVIKCPILGNSRTKNLRIPEFESFQV